jgi:hypothetical protein
VPRHVARLVTRLLASLVVDYSASCRLVVVDYFAFAARPGASARRAARHAACRAARRRLLIVDYSSSTTLPSSRVWVLRHVARLATRLVAPLVVDYFASRRLIVDYSVRHDFVLRPHWLYFSHTVRGDYLSRGNTGSTSSTPRTARMSSSGRIASTISSRLIFQISRERQSRPQQLVGINSD